MPNIDKHEEGSYSYSDLSTTDLEGAKTFYTGLFGWDVNELPMGEGQVYVMFKKDGRSVCAVSLQQPEQRDAGVPPMWNTYFTADDVDAKAKEIEQAGGTIHAQPFDVFESGRMSVVTEPAGAFFCIWQAKDDIGAEVMNDPNTLTWADCVTTDVEKSKAFFSEVFGWTSEEWPGPGDNPYILMKRGDRPVCGVMNTPAPGMPSFFLNYFAVANCDDAVAKAQELGATIQQPPTPIPDVGRFALVSDPQGAGFGVIEPEQTA